MYGIRRDCRGGWSRARRAAGTRRRYARTGGGSVRPRPRRRRAINGARAASLHVAAGVRLRHRGAGRADTLAGHAGSPRRNLTGATKPDRRAESAGCDEIRIGRTGLPSPKYLPGYRRAMRPAGRTPSDPSMRLPLQSHRSRYGTFSGTSRPWCAVFRGRRLRAPRTPTPWLSK